MGPVASHVVRLRHDTSYVYSARVVHICGCQDPPNGATWFVAGGAVAAEPLAPAGATEATATTGPRRCWLTGLVFREEQLAAKEAA